MSHDLGTATVAGPPASLATFVGRSALILVMTMPTLCFPLGVGNLVVKESPPFTLHVCMYLRTLSACVSS